MSDPYDEARLERAVELVAFNSSAVLDVSEETAAAIARYMLVFINLLPDKPMTAPKR